VKVRCVFLDGPRQGESTILKQAPQELVVSHPDEDKGLNDSITYRRNGTVFKGRTGWTAEYLEAE
jgi:hypothetical protein